MAEVENSHETLYTICFCIYVSDKQYLPKLIFNEYAH